MSHVETLEAAGNSFVGALLIVAIFVVCGLVAYCPTFVRGLLDLHHRRLGVVRRSTPTPAPDSSRAPREDSDG